MSRPFVLILIFLGFFFVGSVFQSLMSPAHAEQIWYQAPPNRGIADSLYRTANALERIANRLEKEPTH